MPSKGQLCAGGCGGTWGYRGGGYGIGNGSYWASDFDDTYCKGCEDESPAYIEAERVEAQRVEAQRVAQRRQQQEEEAAQRRQQKETQRVEAQRVEAQRVEAQPAHGSMEEWVQSTFGPSGFAWNKAKCAALSAALAEEEIFTTESVAKMDDGDVVDISQNAGLKKGSAQQFKEGHAALQKACCSVRLTLATLTGQTTIVAVRPDDTVQSIKDKAVVMGVAGAAHNLVHGKEQLLETNRTVHEFGLSDGDTLHVVPVTRGMI